MDLKTLNAYEAAAPAFAADWHAQPTPTDLHAIVRRFFVPGSAGDIGCGSGREVAFLAAGGFAATGYDACEALLAQARLRYPDLAFEQAALPALTGVADCALDNVLCETVIMHLPCEQIAPAIARLQSTLRPGGILYLSWRVTEGGDQRDSHGRLYSAFDAGLVRDGLGKATPLLDEEVISLSSGKTIHRIVARKN